MKRNCAYEQQTTAWIDCLTQRVSTLVRLKGPLQRDEIDRQITELLEDMAIARKRADTTIGRKLVRAINRLKWARIEIKALRHARRRFFPDAHRPH